MKEEWRPIKGYPDYQVSSIGRVKSLARISRGGKKIKERIMKLRIDKDKKYSCNLVSEQGVSRKKYVHIEMARSFLRDLEDNEEVSMKDGNHFNLKIENLLIESKKERLKRFFNSEHMKSKTSNRLNGVKTREIQNSIRQGFSDNKIANLYSVGRQQVSRVRNNMNRREASR